MVDYLMFPTKNVQFMRIIHIQRGEGVQITDQDPTQVTHLPNITDPAHLTDPTGHATPQINMCR